jgi:hypothetical protein
MKVFLGGSCGASDWRRQVAIPALAAAGLDWFDPQLGEGKWSLAEHEVRDMREKALADVLLFVIEGTTRAVASLAEAAYLIAAQRPLALAVSDVPEGARLHGHLVDERERSDLNRGRAFVRTMAAEHGVPCFGEASEAAAHAITLARRLGERLDLPRLRAILADVDCGQLRFLAEEQAGALFLSIERAGMRGRRWLIEPGATPGEVVQSALKAVLAWEEHEARERFRYRGQSIFGPHLDLEALGALARDRP